MFNILNKPELYSTYKIVVLLFVQQYEMEKEITSHGFRQYTQLTGFLKLRH